MKTTSQKPENLSPANSLIWDVVHTCPASAKEIARVSGISRASIFNMTRGVHDSAKYNYDAVVDAVAILNKRALNCI